MEVRNKQSGAIILEQKIYQWISIVGQ